MKYIIEFKIVDEDPEEGDYVIERYTNRLCILGEFGQDTGFSNLYNLDGSFYDTGDWFDKAIPINVVKRSKFFIWNL